MWTAIFFSRKSVPSLLKNNIMLPSCRKSETSNEQIPRNAKKLVKNCDFGHFLAHLAKIGQNVNFHQKSGRAIFIPLLSPNFMPSFGKILGAVSEINSLHPYIHPYIHTYKGDPIEPVAFTGSTSIPWNNEPAPFGSLSAIFLGTKKNFFEG